MKYANQLGWTDVNPYEVINVISEKTIEVRAMHAERDESVKLEFIPGGFSAHCVNDRDQKWFITSNVEAPVIRIRLSKNRGWQNKHGARFKLSDTPCKYYDYNF